MRLGAFELSAAKIGAARLRARGSGRRIIDELLDSEGSTANVLDQLSALASMPAISIDELRELAPVFEFLAFREAIRRQSLVMTNGQQVIVVISDPFDLELHSWLLGCVGKEQAVWRIALPTDLTAFFAMHEDSLPALGHSAFPSELPVESQQNAEQLDYSSIFDHGSPVVKLVHSTIYDAMKTGASDVHLETSQEGLTVKYRLDGVLVKITSSPGLEFADEVVSRVKIMAELDIAERRVPQDGRFRLRYKGREIDYRVSVMPNMVSEDVVIRILDKSSLADAVAGLSLERLGFDPATLAQVRRLSHRPYGMFLVTGPTGSGKTTTMYAALSELNDGRDKIITIEDPVEYQLPGVLQIPVNERKGLTFARGLRSILRHDPDKILIGEVRDPETAQIAVQSALTGHLVFTSVHANNVFDVIGRFLHMGVDTYSFVAALNGILAQRLLRLICNSCSSEYDPDESQIAEARLSREQIAQAKFRHGSGCGHCRGTGFKGRHAVGEVLILTDELRQLIAVRAPIAEIKAAARASGTRYLHEAALDLVLAGRTTLQEMNRVTFVS